MIASRGVTLAVDWEQRTDYPRLRSERLERARAALRDADLVPWRENAFLPGAEAIAASVGARLGHRT